MKASATNIFRRILLVVFGIALGFGVYSLNASSISQNALPMPFGFGLATVQSGSMEPALHKGDLLFVTARPAYNTGDVVVYQQGSALVAHRIVQENNGVVTTQGDANNTTDEPFSTENIKGTVVFSLPALGYVVDFVKTPFGLIVVLAAAILLVEYSFRREVKHNECDEKAQCNARLREEIEYLRAQQNAQRRANTRAAQDGKGRTNARMQQGVQGYASPSAAQNAYRHANTRAARRQKMQAPKAQTPARSTQKRCERAA